MARSLRSRASFGAVALLACTVDAGCGALLALRSAPDGGPAAGSDGGAVPPADAGYGDDDGGAVIHGDGGATPDAGAPPDAGADVDAGLELDAGADVDAGLESDAGADADAGPNERGCGTAFSIQDDFASTITAPFWLRSSSGSVSLNQPGEVLDIVLADSESGYRYGEYALVGAVALRDSWFSVDVHQYPTQVAGTELFIAAQHDDDNRLRFSLEGGKLAAAVVVDGAAVGYAELDYNSNLHRFWRARESGGRVYLEVSANESSWTPMAEEAAPAWVDHVTLVIRASTDRAVADPGQARIGGVNVGAPFTPLCSARSLVDAFDGTTLDDRWFERAPDPGCVASVADGMLTLSQPSGTLDCSVEARDMLVIDEQGIVVELDAAPAAFDSYAGLELWQPGAYVEWLVSADSLFAYVSGGSDEVPVDDVPHTGARFLALARSGDALVFRASNDGVGWTTYDSSIPPVPLDNALVTLWLTDGYELSDGGSVRIRAVNPQ